MAFYPWQVCGGSWSWARIGRASEICYGVGAWLAWRRFEVLGFGRRFVPAKLTDSAQRFVAPLCFRKRQIYLKHSVPPPSPYLGSAAYAGGFVFRTRRQGPVPQKENRDNATNLVAGARLHRRLPHGPLEPRGPSGLRQCQCNSSGRPLSAGNNLFGRPHWDQRSPSGEV